MAMSVKKQYRKLYNKIQRIGRKWDRAIEACEKKKQQLDKKFGKIIDRYEAKLAKLEKKL